LSQGAAAFASCTDNGASLHTTLAANADSFVRSLAPVIADIRASCLSSLRGIAAELTVRQIRTLRGDCWAVGNVRALLERIDGLQPAQTDRTS